MQNSRCKKCFYMFKHPVKATLNLICFVCVLKPDLPCIKHSSKFNVFLSTYLNIFFRYTRGRMQTFTFRNANFYNKDPFLMLPATKIDSL